MTEAARARGLDRCHQVYLVEIETLGGGPVLYFSDRNVAVDGVPYEDCLEGLDGLGEELSRADSSGKNAALSLRFKNCRFRSYARLAELDADHPLAGAACAVREAYIGEGGEASGPVTLFCGVLDEPRGMDLMGFSCGVSSREFAADNRW